MRSSYCVHQPGSRASRVSFIRSAVTDSSTVYRAHTSRRVGRREPVSMRLILAARAQKALRCLLDGQPWPVAQLPQAEAKFSPDLRNHLLHVVQTAILRSVDESFPLGSRHRHCDACGCGNAHNNDLIYRRDLDACTRFACRTPLQLVSWSVTHHAPNSDRHLDLFFRPKHNSTFVSTDVSAVV